MQRKSSHNSWEGKEREAMQLKSIIGGSGNHVGREALGHNRYGGPKDKVILVYTHWNRGSVRLKPSATFPFNHIVPSVCLFLLILRAVVRDRSRAHQFSVLPRPQAHKYPSAFQLARRTSSEHPRGWLYRPRLFARRWTCISPTHNPNKTC